MEIIMRVVIGFSILLAFLGAYFWQAEQEEFGAKFIQALKGFVAVFFFGFVTQMIVVATGFGIKFVIFGLH